MVSADARHVFSSGPHCVGDRATGGGMGHLKILQPHPPNLDSLSHQRKVVNTSLKLNRFCFLWERGLNLAPKFARVV